MPDRAAVRFTASAAPAAPRPGVSAFPPALAAPVGVRRATPQEPGRSTRPTSRTRRMPAPASSLPAGVRSRSPRPRWARTTIRPGTA